MKIHRIAADGAAVLTEHTDALIVSPLRVQFWVCGVFEVHDGRITLWRDYFDLFDVVKATVRGGPHWCFRCGDALEQVSEQRGQ